MKLTSIITMGLAATHGVTANPIAKTTTSLTTSAEHSMITAKAALTKRQSPFADEFISQIKSKESQLADRKSDLEEIQSKLASQIEGLHSPKTVTVTETKTVPANCMQTAAPKETQAVKPDELVSAMDKASGKPDTGGNIAQSISPDKTTNPIAETIGNTSPASTSKASENETAPMHSQSADSNKGNGTAATSVSSPDAHKDNGTSGLSSTKTTTPASTLATSIKPHPTMDASPNPSDMINNMGPASGAHSNKAKGGFAASVAAIVGTLLAI